MTEHSNVRFKAWSTLYEEKKKGEKKVFEYCDLVARTKARQSKGLGFNARSGQITHFQGVKTRGPLH